MPKFTKNSKQRSRIKPLSALPKPIIIAHRGSSLMFPENSVTAFREMAAINAPVIEMDVVLLSDNTTGVMHDGTVDRTSSATGNVNTFTQATWQAATLDPSNFLKAVGYADTEKLPIFSEVLSVLKGRALIMPEAKSTGCGELIAREARRFGIKNHEMIVQSFSLTELVAPAAAGYECLYLTSTLSSITDWEAIRAAGIQYVSYGTSEAGNAARVAAANAAGVRIIRYTLNYRKYVQIETATGVDGVITDDYPYLITNTALRNTDTWSTGKWMQGMVASTNRGEIFASGEWGYTAVVPSYYGCLMGWACPIATPTNYTITFDVKVTALYNDDKTRWSSIFINASDDTPHYDLPADAINGYHLLFRANGELVIFKKVSGNNVVLVAASSTSEITLNTWIPLRVTVTPTTITFTRLDTNGSVTTNDSAFRGGYFFLGRMGAAARFRNVVVS